MPFELRHCPMTIPPSSLTSTRRRWRSTTASTIRRTSTTRTRRSKARWADASVEDALRSLDSLPEDKRTPFATTPAGTRITRCSGKS